MARFSRFLRAPARGASFWPLALDLARFPPIECVIGYGSGVFRQRGYSEAKRPMVDLIFVVRAADARDWHAENLRAHAEHYAGLLRWLGPGAITSLQDCGPGLYYNTKVAVPTLGGGSVEAKYGVMDDEAFLRDLRDWDSLYVAGRLHKPCVIEFPGVDEELRASFEVAIAANRRAALSAALLTAPLETPLPWSSLLGGVVQLSYSGDVRTGIAENPSKVSNIVAAQEELLSDIYLSIASDLGVTLSEPAGGVADFDQSPAARRRLFHELPEAVQRRADVAAGSSLPWTDPDALRRTLCAIVRRSSLVQTCKGALTAGPARAAAYALEKVRKRFE